MISPPVAATFRNFAELSLSITASDRHFAAFDEQVAVNDVPGVRISRSFAASGTSDLLKGVPLAVNDTSDGSSGMPDDWLATSIVKHGSDFAVICQLHAAIDNNYAVNSMHNTATGADNAATHRLSTASRRPYGATCGSGIRPGVPLAGKDRAGKRLEEAFAAKSLPHAVIPSYVAAI